MATEKKKKSKTQLSQQMHKKVSRIILKNGRRTSKQRMFHKFGLHFYFFNVFEISKGYETLRMINFGWKESRKLWTGITPFSPKTIFT